MVGAQRQVWLQTFSFEGDRVGRMLGRALLASPAVDRRLLVDGYSLLYHSDRIIPGPAWLDPELRREFYLTRRWMRRLRAAGVRFRFGNPPGPLPTGVVRRNHKKLAVVDERVSYLGGINFSEHNFAWHDMMLRVESEDLARVLAKDFTESWVGRGVARDVTVGPLRVVSLNGRANARGLLPVLQAIGGARRSIDVVSAYLSHPFTHVLAEARRRGVRIRILTPGENNKPNLACHVEEQANRFGFELYRFAGGMSHMKAMLVDDELLIAGSSNFDFMSYHILEELIVMTRDREVVATFRTRVWEPDLASAERAHGEPCWRTRLGHAQVMAGCALASLLAVR